MFTWPKAKNIMPKIDSDDMALLTDRVEALEERTKALADYLGVWFKWEGGDEIGSFYDEDAESRQPVYSKITTKIFKTGKK